MSFVLLIQAQSQAVGARAFSAALKEKMEEKIVTRKAEF